MARALLLRAYMVGQGIGSKRVVWAVDPFEARGAAQLHSIELVNRLQQEWGARIMPVHILSPAELNLSVEFAGPWVGQYRPSAEKALARLFAEFSLSGLEPPEIIVQMTASTSRTVDVLIDRAAARSADAILVGSHGRTGVSRWLIGSFAETLLQRSRLPVIVAGAHMRAERELKHLLFPTDFGEDAKTVFKRAVGLARELGGRMTLYHSISRPIEPVYQTGIFLAGSPWIPVQEYYNRELARHQRHADAWAQWASRQGVHTETLVDTETRNVADSILEVARKRDIGCIAMAAHSGPLAAVFLGSVTRKVVRGAECPVWVLRLPPKAEAQGAKPAAA